MLKQPFVSVIMPVYNEADFIKKSLNSVLSQKYPSDSMEIIIADGQSTDGTVEIIESLKDSSNFPIHIVINLRKIAPIGLNCAIAKAKGEIIIRVDGHCEIEPDYVINCVKYLQENKADGVGGPIETIGKTLTSKAIAAAMSSNFGVGGSAFRCINNREMYVDTVAFPAYKREVFEKIGLFNEELVRNQDDEFNYRLRKSGGQILLAPDINSRYYSRSNFKSLARQYFQYGFWKVKVFQLHPKQMSLRQFVPLLFISTVFILLLTSLFSIWGQIILAGVLSLYLFAALYAGFKIVRNLKLSALPLVIFSFAILHFSYGFGFLAGLIHFRGNWGNSQNKSSTDSVY
jgi:succinoglycan biosynthesis protein ExoA